jgi:hypothetical protein
MSESQELCLSLAGGCTINPVFTLPRAPTHAVIIDFDGGSSTDEPQSDSDEEYTEPVRITRSSSVKVVVKTAKQTKPRFKSSKQKNSLKKDNKTDELVDVMVSRSQEPDLSNGTMKSFCRSVFVAKTNSDMYSIQLDISRNKALVVKQLGVCERKMTRIQNKKEALVQQLIDIDNEISDTSLSMQSITSRLSAHTMVYDLISDDISTRIGI